MLIFLVSRPAGCRGATCSDFFEPLPTPLSQLGLCVKSAPLFSEPEAVTLSIGALARRRELFAKTDVPRLPNVLRLAAPFSGAARKGAVSTIRTVLGAEGGPEVIESSLPASAGCSIDLLETAASRVSMFRLDLRNARLGASECDTAMGIVSAGRLSSPWTGTDAVLAETARC